MNIIDQIKAEIERRIKSWQTRGEHSPEGQGKDTCVSRVTELTDLLSFISDLEKSMPINSELRDARRTEEAYQKVAEEMRKQIKNKDITIKED